jgi:hypothetical protein
VQINNSWVSLFWFNKEYTEIAEYAGKVEFYPTDIIYRNTVLPAGSHRDNSPSGAYSYDVPRGRIEVESGRIIISVGIGCPDSLIEKVIIDNGLTHYRAVLEIRRSQFWDRRR